LNITVLSNDSRLDVGLNACRELVPDLWTLADDLPIALDELLSAARKQRSAPPRTRTRPAKRA
jgi:hypothetical protein